MKKIMIPISLILTLFFWVPAALSQENVVIQTRLFKGTRVESVSKAEPTVVFTYFFEPVVFPMQARSIDDADLWIAAIKKDMANIYQLKTVDHLVSSSMIWDRRKSNLNEMILVEHDIYPIHLSPRLLPNDTVSLKIVIEKYTAEQMSLSAAESTLNPDSRTGIFSDAELMSLKSKKDKERLILDTEIVLNYDDPVVLGLPSDGNFYFLSLLLKKAKEKEVVGGVVSGPIYVSIKGQDPVCGKWVGRGTGFEKENRATNTYEYQGKSYLFCSKECYEKFRADPEKYITQESPGTKEKGTQVSTDVFTPPKPIFKEDPVYPPNLEKENIKGQVVLEVSTDEKGNVIRVRLLRSLHPDLDKSAQEVLKRWKFEPVLVNGKSIPVTFTMSVNFKGRE
jgi:TonB family protein